MKVWFISLCLFLLTTQAAIAENSLLFFSANWCEHCKKAKADIQENKIEIFSDLIYIDYDESKDLVQSYGVKKIPTFILLNKNGVEVDRKVGYHGIKNLIDFVLQK